MTAPSRQLLDELFGVHPGRFHLFGRKEDPAALTASAEDGSRAGLRRLQRRRAPW